MDFLTDFLTDQKNAAAGASLIAAILVQLAAHHGWALDPATADKISGMIVLLGTSLVLGHAHVHAASVRADGDVDAAQAAAKAANPPSHPKA